MIAVLACIACGAAACSMSLQGVEDDIGQTDASLMKNAVKLNANWDEAVAPMSCKNFKFVPPYWVITGSVVANGVLFADTPIADPAGYAAVQKKVTNHIGPDC